MSRTPPTIVAPLPRDPRVMVMAKALNVSRADAYTAVADVWAMLAADAEGDIVKGWTLEMLDAVVEVEMKGCAAVMVQVGLVGVADDGIVKPSELRHRQQDTKADLTPRRTRSQGAERQRRYRDRKRLSVPVPKREVPVKVAEDTGLKRTPRRLGEVDGYPVMLLFRKDGVPFYKLEGASPEPWTGTVTDQANPSFAEALVAIHGKMKREAGNGLGDTFRPSLSAVVAAAERYRADRASAAADAARRDEANQALAEASAEDQGDAVDGVAERHESVTGDARNVTPVTGDASGDALRYALEHPSPEAATVSDGPQRDAQRYGERLSSSSSSAVSGSPEQLSNENTTTTKGVTPAERDHEERILDRILGAGPSRQGDGPWHDDDPVVTEQRRRKEERLRRIAAALGDDIDKVRIRHSAYLELQCREAGIDFRTGHPVNADAPDEPAEARDDIGTTTVSSGGDMPAAGSVGARGDDGRDHDQLPFVERLRKSCTTLRAAADLGATLTMKSVGGMGANDHHDVESFKVTPSACPTGPL